MELKLEHLYKNYKKKVALSDVNLTLSEGVYGLLGENGAGKSTLMRILATVDIQTQGAVAFDGTSIIELGRSYRSLVGYMPQDYNVPPGFTAKTFLNYIGALKGIDKKILNRKIPEILEFVNLKEVADKKVTTFSGGMKRRLGIGQAILGEPKILIFDEPTAGLDPKERIRFSNCISAMSKGKIVILSTHIISDIEAISNQVVVIREGKIIASGKIEKLIKNVEGRIWEAEVPLEVFLRLSRQRKVIRRKQKDEDILVRYAGKHFEEADNKAIEPTLEDFYVEQCI